MINFSLKTKILVPRCHVLSTQQKLGFTRDFTQIIIITILLNKGPSSQSYGFSSSLVWMWELNQ